MKKKIVIISLVAILLMFVGTGFLIFSYITNKVTESSEKYNNDVKELNEKYNALTKLVSEYNSMRETLDGYIEQATYYEEFSKVVDELYDFYGQYDNKINEINDIGDRIKYLCRRNYNEEDLMSKCNSYSEITGSIVTVYGEDVRFYNDLVDRYNEWIVDNKNSDLKEATKFAPTKIVINNNEEDI